MECSTTLPTLPTELIMDIIELAEDRPALKGWLEAAKGNECLYQFVHRRYWSSLEIDHADLVTSPWELRVYERRASRSKRDNYEYDGRLRFNEFSSEDEQGESSAERQDRLKKEWWNEMYGQKQYRDREIERSGRIYDAVRPDPLARGIIPARLVRDLTFGLTFDAFLLRHQSNPSFLQASVPTGETLEHSLTQLFPWFVNVQSVTVRGVVTQELLNRIASLPRRNVKFLKLRVQSCLAYFRTAGLRGLCNAYFIDWTALKQFTSLHTLQINNLRHDEGSSLAVAVGGLTSLEKLHVESIYAIGQLQSSPLTAFFSGLFSNSWSNTGRAVRDGSRIPRTLKSLHINDKYYMDDGSAVVGAPLADRKLIYPHLSHVFLCLNDGPTVRNMLTWLNLPSLTTLTIPGGDFSAHNDQTQTDEIANAFWTDHIKDILEENPTITKLTLLNAWKIRMDVLNILSSDLEGKYSGKDLILCTKDWISHSLQGTRSIAPLIYGLRNAQIPNRWGSKIQRVKLLDSRPWMDFDCIEPSFLHSIRILVLHQNTEQTVNTEPLDTFAEGKLATTMASHMPALKLLVFREYIFWIQHLDPLEKPLDRPLDASELQDIQDGEEKQEETFKIWYLKEARRDPEQARAITENLSAEDWQFIDHDPTIIPAESNYEGRFDPARNKIDTNLVVFYKTAKEDHCNA